MPRSAARAADPGLDPARTPFARDVRDGLLARPKRLPARWFYDALGSTLFDAIGRLPWYRITRAELALLSQHTERLAASLGPEASLIELGVGTGEKLAVIVEAATRHVRSFGVHLVDVSARALDSTEVALAPFSGVRVTRHETTYEDGLRRAAAAAGHARQLVLFLGSNLGNFDPPEAEAFVRQIGRTIRPGDLLLLGLDLVKPAADLLLAYDDPLGLTAVFNKNVLLRMNTELGAEFRLDRFEHEARWVAGAARVEMHLVSREAQSVEIPEAGCTVQFEAGESIWTESSYKFQRDDIERLGRVAGLTPEAYWLHAGARFALTLFRRV